MYIALLGRQPHLGIAELERVYGSSHVSWFGAHAAAIESESFALERLGGSLKAGRVVAEATGDWRKLSQKLVRHYEQQWSGVEGKLTLGISAYGFHVSPRDVQKTGIVLKQRLKQRGVSVRLVPNDDVALSTATSHHNKLGRSANKVELLVVSDGHKTLIAESVGVQNISAYAARDQGRPKRDAFVGMLPPKLAQIIVNLAAPSRVESAPSRVSTEHLQPESDQTSGLLSDAARSRSGADTSGKAIGTPVLLDPFCGTGVILQEALLAGYAVYGTDLADKMIDYSGVNIDWIKQKARLDAPVTLHQGDAMTTSWQQPIDIVACESYLGQPFSAPPSPAKLREVRGNCDHIISKFLRNIGSQLTPGTPLCVAVPAWRDASGRFTHLPLIDSLDTLGYSRVAFTNVKDSDLLYYREDQVVARELLVLVKK